MSCQCPMCSIIRQAWLRLPVSCWIPWTGRNGQKGCVDNDECEGGAHDCHPDETCMNTDGSYTCKLEYDPFGVCESNAHDCHPLAACTPFFPNGKAEHKCTCRAGYQG